MIGRDVVHGGHLAREVARGRAEGIDVFVVDAESEDDVHAAVAAIVALPRPLCLAGSIALATALGLHVGREPGCGAPKAGGVPLPALIVNGSLHSRARAQIEAVLATGRATALALAGDEDSSLAALATQAAEALARGTSVVIAPRPSPEVPTGEACRATERGLAAAVVAIAARTAVPTLVLIGGETSHAVLMRLGAGTVAVNGRIAPLIARGMIERGTLAGATVITKGGSGGTSDVLAALLVASAGEAT